MSSSAAVIIQLISGTLGGNIAAFFFKKIFLGTVLNSIPGIIGGRLGGRFSGHRLWLLEELALTCPVSSAASSVAEWAEVS